MKILHITRRMSIGGAEIVIQDLCYGAVKDGHDVSIIVFSDHQNHIVNDIKNNNVNFIVSPMHRFISFMNVFFLIRHFKNNDYDIIHVHLTMTKILLAIVNAVSKKSLPLIIIYHSKLTWTDKLNKTIMVWVNKQYKKIICVSSYVQNNIVSFAPMLKKKCVTIHNGIDLEIFSNKKLPKRNVNNNKLLHIICVSRLSKEKGVATCIRAIQLCQSDVYLSIIGDGQQWKMLTGLIKKLNLENKVYLKGWKNNVPDLLKQADVYVQPSFFEGFGIAAVEAMASGLPMIISDAPGLLEIVGNAGLVFPIGDARRLAEHIDLLARNDELRCRLSELALQRAQQFSFTKTWEGYCKVYESITHEQPT